METLLQYKTAILGTTAAAAIGYLVYFDYRRQTDPEFRRRIRRERRRAIRAERDRMLAANPIARITAAEALALASLSAAPNPENRQNYVLENLAKGEENIKLGPEKYVDATIAFYRALGAYPNPNELLQLLQQVAPAPVWQLLTEMLRAPSATAASAAAAKGPILEEIS